MTTPEDNAADRRFLARADEILREEESDSASAATGAGRVVGGYRLVRRLGYGGMGVVWLAEDVELQRRVAIKFLAPHMTFDAEAVWRFRQEATATARLDHPGIVAVHSAGAEGDERHLVMEFVDGVPLHRLLMRLAGRRPEDVSLGAVVAAIDEESPGMGAAVAIPGGASASYLHAAAEWTAQAAEAVAHAHSRGVLHRDLKPSNLILDRNGRVRVVDFGLARIEQQAPVTRTEAVIGTMAYVAPEVLTRGSAYAEARSDVYSLGVVLYELVGLRPPFIGESFQILRQVSVDPPPRLRLLHRGVPPDLEWIVQKCLAKEPQMRYATAQDLADDLRRFVAGEPVLARQPALSTVIRSLVRRHPVRAFAAVVLLVMLTASFPVLRAMDVAAARREAASERSYLDLKLAEYQTLAAELARGRAASREVIADYGDSEGAAKLARHHKHLRELHGKLAATMEDARGAVERAARIEGGRGELTRETEEALARFHLFRFERAVEAGDEEEVSLARSAVVAHDRRGVHAEQLAGSGTLRYRVVPADAEVSLFRYEDYSELRAAPPQVPRLVPVPWGAAGRCRSGEWIPGFFPGDPCLAVLAVAEGSPAFVQGVRAGDLVLRINGSPCGNGCFVSRVRPGSEAARAGIRAWDRIEEWGGVSILNAFDWEDALSSPEGGPLAVVLGGRRLSLRSGPSARAQLGVDAVPVEDVLRQPAAPEGSELLVLIRGAAHVVRVLSPDAAGVRCERTAYPLILSAENRLSSDGILRLAPGSYLLVARRDGFEQLRFPIVVPRHGSVEADLHLLAEGSTPESFVWIPPGTSLLDGDPEFRRPRTEEPKPLPRTVPGFFIRRTEMTLREWFEFINDPETVIRIQQSIRSGWLALLPRHYQDRKELYDVDSDGKYGPVHSEDAPLLGISGKDVEAYLEWRAARDRARGERWLWAKPTCEQWQRAARGADGRVYPWGNDRYEPDPLCVNLHRQKRWLAAERGRFEPRDESPFGVFDMAGSRREWTTAALLGGSWADGEQRLFRASFHDGVGDGYFNWSCGFRPVLVPNPDAR